MNEITSFRGHGHGSPTDPKTIQNTVIALGYLPGPKDTITEDATYLSREPGNCKLALTWKLHPYG